MSSEKAFKGCFRITMGKDHITVPDAMGVLPPRQYAEWHLHERMKSWHALENSSFADETEGVSRAMNASPDGQHSEGDRSRAW